LRVPAGARKRRQSGNICVGQSSKHSTPSAAEQAALKVLYLTTEIPYPLTSGFLRHYHFLRSLGQKHKITYCSLTKKPRISPEALAALQPFTERIMIFGETRPREPLWVRWLGALPLVGAKPQKALRFRAAARAMKKAVRELLQREAFDVVMYSGKNTFPVIADLRGVPIVADCCDATSARVRGEMRHANFARRLWLLMRYLEVRRIEKRLVRKTPHLAFASRRDRALLLAGAENGEIIPQAVEVDFWRRLPEPRADNCIIFTGVMNYAPNHDAALFLLEHVWPRLQSLLPKLELVLAGRDPLPALKAAAQRIPNVTVTGFVDDLRPYLSRATLYVAPIRFASGVQNKILEALAMELPVITTPVVAEGLRLGDGSAAPLRVAQSAPQFAAAIVELLQHPEECRRLAQAGRQFVEQHFVWPRNIAKLEALWLAAAGRNGAA